MVEDSINNVEEITAAYVNSLKDLLLQKNKICNNLQQKNNQLLTNIQQLKENINEINIEKEFHQFHASLLTSCYNPSSGPSEVVRIVSSWLPENCNGNIACCLKIGDNWMIIEEQESDVYEGRVHAVHAGRFPGGGGGGGGSGSGSGGDGKRQRRLHRSIAVCVSNNILDEIVLCSGISVDGVCSSNPIDESELPSRGWTRDHDSVALVVCPQCVWILVSENSHETTDSVKGFYNLLESATELVMGMVSGDITRDDAELQSIRMESSLCVNQLLLSPPPTLPTLPVEGGAHTTVGDDVFTGAHTMQVWESLPKVLETAASPSLSTVSCDVVLFLSNAKPIVVEADESMESSAHFKEYNNSNNKSSVKHRVNACTGSPILLSAKHGPLHHHHSNHGHSPGMSRSSSNHFSSLTKSAILDRMDILICNDADNIARDDVIDCGVIDSSLRHHSDSNHASSTMDDISLAILPLWTQTEHSEGKCFLLEPHSGYPLLCVSGAVIFRKYGQPFSESDVKYLQHLRDDSLPKVSYWLESHLCSFVRQVSAGHVHFSSETQLRRQYQQQQQQLLKHRSTYRSDSQVSGLKNSRGSDNVVSKPTMLGITSLRNNHEMLEVFLKNGFSSLLSDHSCEMAVFLAASYGCEWAVMIDVSQGGDDRSLMGYDDFGERFRLELPHESIDKNPLTQSIKHFLAQLSSDTDVLDSESIVLNHLLTDHESTEKDLRGFVNSLLNKKSKHRITSPGVRLNDLLPLHVFCQPIVLSMNERLSGSDDCAGKFILVGGRLWAPFLVNEITDTTTELENVFKTFETCRRKDGLFEVISAANCEIDDLKSDRSKLLEAESVVQNVKKILSQNDNIKGCSGSSNCRSAAAILLDALKVSCETGIFDPSTKLVVCAVDALTDRIWQLDDSRREGLRDVGEIRWRHADPSLNNNIKAWPDNCARSSTFQTDIGSFVEGEHSQYCHLTQLYQDSSIAGEEGLLSSPTLTIYLVVLCPQSTHVSNLLSPMIGLWLSALHAFFASHSDNIIHTGVHRTSSLQNSITRVLAEANASACSCVREELTNFDWVADELDRSDGSVAKGNPMTRNAWEMKPFEFLADVNLWDNAVSEGCMSGKVNVLVPFMELDSREFVSLSGRIERSGECVDLLHPQMAVPEAVKDIISRVKPSTETDDVVFRTQSMCKEYTSTLCVLSGDSSHTRKILQKYLQDKGNFNLNITSDTLLHYTFSSTSINGNDGVNFQHFKSIQVFLLVPADFFFTYDSLAQLEAQITCTLSPIAIIRVHNSLRDDITRFLKIFHGDEPFEHRSDGANLVKGIPGKVHGNHLTIVDSSSSCQTSPVNEIIHGFCVSESIKFLHVIHDLFTAKAPHSSCSRVSDTKAHSDQKRKNGADVAREYDGTNLESKFKFELIDGTVYMQYGSTEVSSNTNKTSKLSKMVTHNYFKQSGGNFKKTFSGAASLLPLPDKLGANSMKKHLVSSPVNIDILPEKHLSQHGWNNCFDDNDMEDDDRSGDGNGSDYSESDDGDDNTLGSVQIIRISFFQHSPLYRNSALSRGQRRVDDVIDDMSHERVIILVRGIVMPIARGKQGEFTSPSSRSFSDSEAVLSSIMVSGLIPLAELHALGSVVNHSFSQMAAVAVASRNEHEHQVNRIAKYQDRLDEVIEHFEHIFTQLSNPKLIDVNSLLQLSSTSGKSIAAPRSKSVLFGKLSRADTIDSTIDRERYYKSVSGSKHSNDGDTVRNNNFASAAVTGPGLKDLVDRDCLIDQEFINKIDPQVSKMAKQSATIAKQIIEWIANTNEQAAQIREFDASIVTAEDTVIELQEDLKVANQQIDLFVKTVTTRVKPILEMLRQRIASIGGYLQDPHADDRMDMDGDSHDGSALDHTAASEMVFSHLDTIQHSAAYYHDLLIHLISEVTSEKGMNVKVAECILNFSARWCSDSMSEKVPDGVVDDSMGSTKKFKLFWPSDVSSQPAIHMSSILHDEKVAEQWCRLPLYQDVANMNAFTWCIQSLSATTTTTSSNPTGGVLNVTYTPIVVVNDHIEVPYADTDYIDVAKENKCFAILQEVHTTANPTYRSNITTTSGDISIPMVDMMRALLYHVVHSFNARAIAQKSIFKQIIEHSDKVNDAEAGPRGYNSKDANITISYQGMSLSYSTSRHGRQLEDAEEIARIKYSEAKVNLLRQQSSSWFNSAVVGERLTALCSTFCSPMECYASIDSNEDSNAMFHTDLAALCEVGLALTGGVCNVGVLLTALGERTSDKDEKDLRVDGLCGVMYHGNEVRIVTSTFTEIARLSVPMQLPKMSGESLTEGTVTVGLQHSVIASIITLSANNIRGSASERTQEPACYVVCVPLADNDSSPTTTPQSTIHPPPSSPMQGYLFLEYASKPDLTVIPIMQSLCRSLIRKWQYRTFVTVVPKLQSEVLRVQEKAMRKEYERQVLAESLSAHKIQWKAFHEFDLLLHKSSSSFFTQRRITDHDNSLVASPVSSRALHHSCNFDVSRDWLQLWAVGSLPDTHDVISGRSIHSFGSPLAAMSSPPAVKPSSPQSNFGDITTATSLVNHIKHNFSSVGAKLMTMIGGVSAVAAVHIDGHTLRYVQRNFSEFADESNVRYDEMEAVEVGAVCLVAGRIISAPEGVRGHPNDPLVFIPVATTNFATSNEEYSSLLEGHGASQSSPSKLRRDKFNSEPFATVGSSPDSCGWVLLISFSCSTQYGKFMACSTPTASCRDDIDKTSDMCTDQLQKCPLSAQDTARWISRCLGRWVKALEIQFVVDMRQRVETYTRGVYGESTRYMATLTSLESSAALKKYIVCNASVAASVAYILHALRNKESEYFGGSHQSPTKQANYSEPDDKSSVVVVRMHWTEAANAASPSTASSAKQWVTISTDVSPSSPNNTDESDIPQFSDPLDSLLHHLKMLQWSVVPSRIPSVELDRVWNEGCAYYRLRSTELDGDFASNVNGRAVRHLYALSTSGQQAVLELVVKTPPVNNELINTVQSQHPSRAHFTSLSSVNENYWDLLPDACLFENVDEATQSDHSLIVDTLRLIPNEISVLLKHVYQSLKNQEQEAKLKSIGKHSYDRVLLLMKCLKELYSIKSRSHDAVIQAMEKVVGSLNGVTKVDIYCRDVHPKHLSVMEQNRNSTTVKSTNGRGGNESEYHIIYGSEKGPLSSGATSPTSSIASSVQSHMSSKDRAKAAIQAEKQKFLLKRQQSISNDTSKVPPASLPSNTPSTSRGFKRAQTTGPLSMSSLQVSSNSSSRAVTGRMEALEISDRKLSTPFTNSGGNMKIDEETEEDSHYGDDMASEISGKSVFTNALSPPQQLKMSQSNAVRRRKTEKNKFQYVFEFQVHDIVGSMTVVTVTDLSSSDTELFSTIASSVGRRIYDMYGDGKQKRMLADLQKELKLKREIIATKEKELAALMVTAQEQVEAIHGAELESEKLRGMLRAEGAALEGCRRLKGESEKHMSEVLDNYRKEFETKEVELSKALVALKKRCSTIEKQLAEEATEKLKAQGEVKRITDRATELEAKRRELADEIVVSKVESTNKINELENRIVKYQNDIVKSQKHQVSAEAKLKTQTSLYEQKSKNSKEKKSTLEQEFAASRTTCARLKQQVDSTTRALALCQRELESMKLRESQQVLAQRMHQEPTQSNVSLKGRVLERSSSVMPTADVATKRPVIKRSQSSVPNDAHGGHVIIDFNKAMLGDKAQSNNIVTGKKLTTVVSVDDTESATSTFSKGDLVRSASEMPSQSSQKAPLMKRSLSSNTSSKRMDQDSETVVVNRKVEEEWYENDVVHDKSEVLIESSDQVTDAMSGNLTRSLSAMPSNISSNDPILRRSQTSTPSSSRAEQQRMAVVNEEMYEDSVENESDEELGFSQVSDGVGVKLTRSASEMPDKTDLMTPVMRHSRSSVPHSFANTEVSVSCNNNIGNISSGVAEDVSKSTAEALSVEDSTVLTRHHTATPGTVPSRVSRDNKQSSSTRTSTSRSNSAHASASGAALTTSANTGGDDIIQPEMVTQRNAESQLETSAGGAGVVLTSGKGGDDDDISVMSNHDVDIFA